MSAVEHPCYRCQADIPENAAFCPHCGAPQIRVIPPEGEAQVPAAGDLSGQAVPQPQSTPPNYWAQAGVSYAPQRGAIQWELAWKGALLSGVGAAVLTAIPFVSIGCLLWMLGAGAASVALYRRQVPGAQITPGMGMKLGALAGVFGFVVNGVVSTISLVLLHNGGNFRREMEEQMQKQMANAGDPKVQQMMQNMVDWMSTPQGAATMIVLVLLIFGAVFVMLTAAGGALGASMLGQRREFR